MQTVRYGNTTTFKYGADGLRRQKTTAAATTDYVVDGQSAVREVVTKPGSTETVTYLTGPRGPEYRRSSTGALAWYVYDGLGSVIGELDSSGNLTSSRLYDVYGLPREGVNLSTSAHQFVGALGHPTDAETELVYMRARYMDPELGRFVSEDPARDGGNWFVYAGNDPVNLVDRNGCNAVAVEVAAYAMLLLRLLGANVPSISYSDAMKAGLNMGAIVSGITATQALMSKGTTALFSRSLIAMETGDLAGGMLALAGGMAAQAVGRSLQGVLIVFYGRQLAMAMMFSMEDDTPAVSLR